jgi:HlyD family secretion protein
VKVLATSTVGAVVLPGAKLLSLVPVNELLRTKVSLQTVIADTGAAQASQGAASRSGAGGAAQQQSISFQAVFELNDRHLQMQGGVYPLSAGLQLAAEIVKGKKTVSQYLLSPVQRVTGETGRER